MVGWAIAHPPFVTLQAIERSVAGNAKTSRKKHKNKVPLMVKKKLSLPLSKLSYTIRGEQLTYSTIEPRIKTIIHFPEWFLKRYPDYQARYANIIYRKGKFYLCLGCQVSKEPLKISGDVIGIDRGLYNIVATSDGKLFNSRQIRAYQRRSLYNRKTLQQKGTWSAKRHLKRLAGTKKRFMQDVNHCISKKLANDKQITTYVLEDLTGIRKKHKSKKLNGWLAQWAFNQFQLFLEYKCEKNGISVKYVNPHYTSQTCNQCNKTNKNQRVKNWYTCSCGYRNHSDVNAAKNIRDKYLSRCLNIEQAALSTSQSTTGKPECQSDRTSPVGKLKRLKYTGLYDRIYVEVPLKGETFRSHFSRNIYYDIENQEVVDILLKSPYWLSEKNFKYILQSAGTLVTIRRGYALGDLIQIIPVIKYMKREFELRFILYTEDKYVAIMKWFNVFEDVFGGFPKVKPENYFMLDGVLENDHSLINEDRHIHRIKLYEKFFHISVDYYDFSPESRTHE